MKVPKGCSRRVVSDLRYWWANLPRISVYSHAKQQHDLEPEQVERILIRDKTLKPEEARYACR